MTNLETILEKIITKLNKIIDNQEKALSPKNLIFEKSFLEFDKVNAIGKEIDFPTPWNDVPKASNPEDVIKA